MFAFSKIAENVIMVLKLTTLNIKHSILKSQNFEAQIVINLYKSLV